MRMNNLTISHVLLSAFCILSKINWNSIVIRRQIRPFPCSQCFTGALESVKETPQPEELSRAYSLSSECFKVLSTSLLRVLKQNAAMTAILKGHGTNGIAHKRRNKEDGAIIKFYLSFLNNSPSLEEIDRMNSVTAQYHATIAYFKHSPKTVHVDIEDEHWNTTHFMIYLGLNISQFVDFLRSNYHKGRSQGIDLSGRVLISLIDKIIHIVASQAINVQKSKQLKITVGCENVKNELW